MIDQVLGAVRMEAENNNCLQGLQVCWPIGGGSGSGMATREKPLTAASSPCQTQMAQTPMERAEVYARALRASQNVKRAEV
jgi:hypothetical protein